MLVVDMATLLFVSTGIEYNEVSLSPEPLLGLNLNLFRGGPVCTL